MELWDAYRKDGRMAGYDLVRGEPIPDGLFHIVSEVVVKHTDGTYLLMRRDLNKTIYPGLWEASAVGSVLKGETPYEGAIRELQEETGIHADELVFLYALSDDIRHSFYYGYLCVTSCEKTSIVLQKGETIDYRWVDRNELLRFIGTPDCVPVHKKRLARFLSLI